MNITTAKQILTKDNPTNLYEVVQSALEVAEVRDLLVEGSFAKPEMYRYNCVRVLHRAMAQSPEFFYQYWDCFVPRLDSPNSFHRSFAAGAIALLSPVDKDCRLDAIFDHYLGLLGDPKTMVVHYFIITLGWIYRARPDFRGKLLDRLLNIDQIRRGMGQWDILKADILGVFEQVYDVIPADDQHRVLAFAAVQLDCSNPRARKLARKFLKVHS